MKKELIYSSALAMLLSASSVALAGGPELIMPEDYFSGFFVGGTGAVHHVDFEGNSQTNLADNFERANTPISPIIPFILTPGGNLLSNTADGESVDGYGGVQGGFGWTFNHAWYLGVMGAGEWGNETSTSDTGPSTLVDFDFFNVLKDKATVSQSTTVRLSNNYNVAGKFGYVLPTGLTLFYGKVGASWADLRVSTTTTATNNFSLGIFSQCGITCINTTASGSTSTEENKTGLLLGLGVEQFVLPGVVSVNLEYNYVNYGTVSTGPVDLTATTSGNIFRRPFGPTTPRTIPVTTQASASAKVDTFLAGINFYFGRHWF